MTEIETLEKELKPEPEVSARRAGLVYVSDDRPGYRRKRWGRGFTYLTPAGEHVKDEALRARFEALVIPPAWTEVWICKDPRGHIRVTGRDEAGRKQYIYHPDWAEARNRTKFDRLIVFGEVLPKIRARVDEDLRRHKLSRQKVVAITVALLEETLIRVGNSEYARRNRSYGLTTLRTRHLDVDGSKLHIEFAGKRGKAQEMEFRDRRLARMVRRIQDLPGQELFQYVVDGDDSRRSVESGDINDYLRAATGLEITAKDYRTWGGTVLAVRALRAMGPAASEGEVEENLRTAVDEVAETLGNTRAVCRDYYIHPVIFEAYADGTLFELLEIAAAEEATDDPYSLDSAELTVMKLLEARLGVD